MIRLPRPRPLAPERGQNVVEFALVLPIVLVLVFGGLQAGMVYFQLTDASYIAAQAATQSARYGGYSFPVHDYVIRALESTTIDPGRFTWRVDTIDMFGYPSCTKGNCPCSYNDQTAVTVTYRWRFSILVHTWEGTYQTTKTALCWRSLEPAGG